MLTTMKRMSISIPYNQEQAILALRKTNDYCRFSYAEIIRMLINEGLKCVGLSVEGETEETS